MRLEKLSPFGVAVKSLNKKDIMRIPISSFEEMLKSEGLLIIDDIQLSPLELKLFCERFSPVEHTDLAKSEEQIDGVLRVTSDKGDNGEPLGIFGHSSSLGWHANRPSSKDRKSIVCTYSYTGCNQTATWWSNTERVYKSLSNEEKGTLKNTFAYFGYKEGSYTEERYKPHVNETSYPIVFKRFGREVLFFPFNQIMKYDYPDSVSMSMRLIDKLICEVTSEKNVYKHEWIGQQLVLSDQWTTIHCRPECKMSGRKILRVSFNYSDDVFPYPGD